MKRCESVSRIQRQILIISFVCVSTRGRKTLRYEELDANPEASTPAIEYCIPLVTRESSENLFLPLFPSILQ